VQEAVETALSRVADHSISVVCAGRTDAGVHALGQVIHFDTRARRDEISWLFGSNSHLPPDICLRWTRPVRADFHARFSAYARRYRYLIYNSRTRSATLGAGSCWYRHPLDAGRMHEAAQVLLGEHDFSAFRAAGCQYRTPWRELHAISVRRNRDLVILDVEGNAFLHHMVRNIAGVLMSIGRGAQTPEWAGEVLASRDRRQAGANAAAHGLYFLEALYPDSFGLQGLTPPHPIADL
jgi:tRNA pseudouridine38-40 synthase